MKLENIIVIEDQNQLFGKTIKARESNIFVGPCKIQDLEYWEDRLDAGKRPYVLIQAETVMSMDQNTGNDEARYAKGYFILTSNDN